MSIYTRSTGLNFHIDTNRINSRQRCEYMNRLERWAEDGVITLESCEYVLSESFAGNDPIRKRKASKYIFSSTFATTQQEQNQLHIIENILFPDGATTSNQENDVGIVFNARKYCKILITKDGASKTQPGRILGNRTALKKQLDIQVMSDEEAVELVQTRIARRDAACRKEAELLGHQLPEWVGKD